MASAATRTRRRFWVWAPRDIAWLACAVQFAGTLWFNWSTGNAVRLNLSAAAADQRVWRPDALGSAAFLVASGLAWMDASRAGRGRTRDWWIGAANMLGSIAFGVSAVAAYVVPATGDVWNAELSNLGTLVGAICFLIGAILLLPSKRATKSQSVIWARIVSESETIRAQIRIAPSFGSPNLDDDAPRRSPYRRTRQPATRGVA